jgi:hypothetical protein
MTDIFRFGRLCDAGDRIHPRDRDIFKRLDNHGFDLKCLPACFWGKLRTAPGVAPSTPSKPGFVHATLYLPLPEDRTVGSRVFR